MKDKSRDMQVERNTDQTDETSVSLMGQTSDDSLGKRSLKRKTICILVSVLLTVTVLSLAVAFVCLSDPGKPARCFASHSFGLNLVECAPADTLESLSSTNIAAGSMVTWNLSSGFNSIRAFPPCEGPNCTDTVATLTKQEQEYVLLAEHTWRIAWEILHDESGWTLDVGTSLKTGRVYSKTYKGLGRISKLKAHVRGTTDQVLNLIINQTSSLPEWDTGTETCRVLQKVNSKVDVYYMITEPVAGGFISRRDYVCVRSWGRTDDYSMIASADTVYPAMPEVSGLIRAHNKPGGMLFTPIENKPNTLLLRWAFATDIGGWVPQWAVDQGLAKSLIQFVHNMQQKLDQINAENH